jgi:hypothetical protein
LLQKPGAARLFFRVRADAPVRRSARRLAKGPRDIALAQSPEQWQQEQQSRRAGRQVLQRVTGDRLM